MLLDRSRSTLLDALADVDVPVVDHEPLPGQRACPYVSLWLAGWDLDYWHWQVRLYVDVGLGARAAQDQIASLGAVIDAAIPLSMGRDAVRIEPAEGGVLVAMWTVDAIRSFV